MVEALNAGLEEGAYEVRASDVEIREVGAVRLVEVVVAFPQGGVGGCDDGEEEG